MLPRSEWKKLFTLTAARLNAGSSKFENTARKVAAFLHEIKFSSSSPFFFFFLAAKLSTQCFLIPLIKILQFTDHPVAPPSSKQQL